MRFLFKMMLWIFDVAPTHQVIILRDLRVSMPDGAELLTDLYLGDANAPVILMRTPYGRSTLFSAGSVYPLASQGFNVVLQSCRGTFGSTGKFNPYFDERPDGLATIEWIKKQPWYGGSIATFGMSYLGHTQWAVLGDAGEDIKAAAMQVTLADFWRMFYPGDSYALEIQLSWTKQVHDMATKGFLILRFFISRLLGLKAIDKNQWMTLPLASIDEQVIGEPVAFWKDWITHNSTDEAWWKPATFTTSIDRIQSPISMVAGWFDFFSPWQMKDYAALRKAGREARITVGPWGHTDSGLGRAAIHDAIEWFNWHLRGRRPVEAFKPVKLYVIGANEWRYFDEWPPRETTTERWYLHPKRALLVARVLADSQPDEYRYDPNDPTPSLGGPPSLDGGTYSVDNAKLEARSDVLTYTSDPLDQPRDVIGTVAAELHISSSVPSADFFVRLCDVDARGISKNVCDGLQRVRIEAAGAPQRVRVELAPIAYRFTKGHRIRLQISSGAFPRWARNLGGAGPIAHQTEAHVAIQRVYHSVTHDSSVLLPFA